jgi:hypothetical protein
VASDNAPATPNAAVMAFLRRSVTLGFERAIVCDLHGYPKHIASLALLFISIGAIALVSDTASAQQQQRLQVRPAATAINPPQQTNTTPDTTPVPLALPGPTDDKISVLGQALAACNQDTAKEAFTLPGLKGEVTLDRCYKGRAHLICVFTALGTEAKSLTGTYIRSSVQNILISILLRAFARSARRPSQPIWLHQKILQRDLRN